MSNWHRAVLPTAHQASREVATVEVLVEALDMVEALDHMVLREILMGDQTTTRIPDPINHQMLDHITRKILGRVINHLSEMFSSFIFCFVQC